MEGAEDPQAAQRPVPQLGDDAEPERAGRRARTARWLGPLAALATWLLVPVGGDALSEGGRATAAVAVLMAIWWVGETLPLAVTSLLPVVLLPMTGALDLTSTTQSYGNPLVLLFLGGFVLALAMQRWGLHRRVALLTIRAVGTEPRRMIGGFMLSTAALSMWVSNTATTVMMLPIGVSVLALVASTSAGEATDGETPSAEAGAVAAGTPNLAVGLLLGIAYSASIGSLATLIGTPPNTFLAGFLSQTYDIDLGFARWMMMALPLSVVFLVVAWFLLTRWLYPPEVRAIPGGADLIRRELASLGPLGRGERNVLIVFVLMAGLWIVRSPLQNLFSGTPLAAIDDPIIAIGGAILLFALPVDGRAGVFTMDWETAKQLPWVSCCSLVADWPWLRPFRATAWTCMWARC